MISPVKVWRRQKRWRLILGKKGKVISWTRIFAASNDFKKLAPYYCVLVKLENGEKIVGQLVDCGEKAAKIGLKVKTVLRKMRAVADNEVVDYGWKFVPER